MKCDIVHLTSDAPNNIEPFAIYARQMLADRGCRSGLYADGYLTERVKYFLPLDEEYEHDLLRDNLHGEVPIVVGIPRTDWASYLRPHLRIADRHFGHGVWRDRDLETFRKISRSIADLVVRKHK